VVAGRRILRKLGSLLLSSLKLSLCALQRKMSHVMCINVRTRYTSHPSVEPAPHAHEITDVRFVHAVVGDVDDSVDDAFGFECDRFHNALEGGVTGHFADGTPASKSCGTTLKTSCRMC
jgi:hypothetical protein